MCFLVIVYIYIYIDIVDTLELRFSRKKKLCYDGKNSTSARTKWCVKPLTGSQNMIVSSQWFFEIENQMDQV